MVYQSLYLSVAFNSHHARINANILNNICMKGCTSFGSLRRDRLRAKEGYGGALSTEKWQITQYTMNLHLPILKGESLVLAS